MIATMAGNTCRHRILTHASLSPVGQIAGTILKTLLVFLCVKKKAMLSLRRKKKLYKKKKKQNKTMNDFISWSLPNL